MLSWTFDIFFPLINVLSLHNPKYNGCNYLVLKCAMNVKAWGVRAPYKLATLLRTNQYNSSHFHVPVSNCDGSFLFPFFFFFCASSCLWYIAMGEVFLQWCSTPGISSQGNGVQRTNSALFQGSSWLWFAGSVISWQLITFLCSCCNELGGPFGSEFGAWIREFRSVVTTDNKNEAYWIFLIISNSGRPHASDFGFAISSLT